MVMESNLQLPNLNHPASSRRSYARDDVARGPVARSYSRGLLLNDQT